MIGSLDIMQILQLAIILLISIGMHEYAHALVSYKLGDPTPKLQDRLSPNPIKHLDPVGFLMIFLIGFGWGKPVQVNPRNYKNPLGGELLVALAGPATNIVLASLGILILLVYGRITGFSLTEVMFGTEQVVLGFWKLFAMINFALAIFNLIPIPPLDGFRIIKMIGPNFARQIERYQLYISIFFLVIILGPGSGVVGNFIFSVSSFLFNGLFGLLSYVIY